jgi:hypothetical protein
VLAAICFLKLKTNGNQLSQTESKNKNAHK